MTTSRKFVEMWFRQKFKSDIIWQELGNGLGFGDEIYFQTEIYACSSF